MRNERNSVLHMLICSGLLIAMTALGNSEKSASNPVRKMIIHSAQSSAQKITVDFKGKSTAEVELDVGSDWQGVVELVGPQATDKLTVRLTYETSVSINDEGPHLDLKDWLHFRSDQVYLRQLDEVAGKKLVKSNSYKIYPEQIKSSNFPFVGKEEFLAAVKSAAEKNKSTKRWHDIAAKCTAPQAEPCHVGVSKVWIQVFTSEEIGSKPVAEVILIPPMGC